MNQAKYTPGPWRCVSTGIHAHDYRLLTPAGDNLPTGSSFEAGNDQSVQRATAQLIAAAPELLASATAAAATIGAIYEWLDRVEKAGGATSLAGIAACRAMITSLRKNAGRTEKLVMEPLRAAIAKATGDNNEPS